MCSVESLGLVMVVDAVRRDARCSWSWNAESSSLNAMSDRPVLISREREPGRIRRIAVKVDFVAEPVGTFASGGEILLEEDAVRSASGPSI